jgi:hypothetical protein
MGIYVSGMRGKVGVLVYYQRNGKTCMRTIAGTVKQTEATKEKAVLFGRAVRLSARLRSGLKEVVENPKAKPIMYALNKGLQKWLALSQPTNKELSTGLPRLTGLPLSKKTSVNQRFKKEIVVNFELPGTVVLTIPELVPTESIIAPAGTQDIIMTVGVVSCKLDEQRKIGDDRSACFKITHDSNPVAERKISFDFPIKPAHLVLVVVSMRYRIPKPGELKIIMEDPWIPVEVVGSCVRGDGNTDDTD